MAAALLPPLGGDVRVLTQLRGPVLRRARLSLLLQPQLLLCLNQRHRLHVADVHGAVVRGRVLELDSRAEARRELRVAGRVARRVRARAARVRSQVRVALEL